MSRAGKFAAANAFTRPTLLVILVASSEAVVVKGRFLRIRLHSFVFWPMEVILQVASLDTAHCFSVLSNDTLHACCESAAFWQNLFRVSCMHASIVSCFLPDL